VLTPAYFARGSLFQKRAVECLMIDEVGEKEAAEPDWALVGSLPLSSRLDDGGPRYTESPPNPNAPNTPFIAEPWNAITASFFIAIVFAWVWRLRGRYGRFPFLCCCLAILLIGGIGGTLYHAFRTRTIYFYLDVVPIGILGVVSSVYLAVRLWHSRGWWYLFGALAGYLGFSGLVLRVIAPLPAVQQVTGDINAIRVNATYAALAIVVLIPLIWTLIRTRFRYAGWVVSGFISFVIAWFCRLIDTRMGPYLPMGSHWLWHTFGAITTAMLIEYFYRVEREPGELGKEER
jgi:hypothetical protein